MQNGFPDQSSTVVDSTLQLTAIFLAGKTVAPLIATPDVDKAIHRRQMDRQKNNATGYMCNSRLQKGITILFCKQLDFVLVQITLVV